MSAASTPFVRESGQGVPVLCLHSNASSSSQWRGLMETLSPHWRMLAPDLLGAGRSGAWPVAAGARLQHELDALAPLLQSLGDRFHVVGHSYGAALALAIAQAAPQRVAPAVLGWAPSVTTALVSSGEWRAAIGDECRRRRAIRARHSQKFGRPHALPWRLGVRCVSWQNARRPPGPECP